MRPTPERAWELLAEGRARAVAVSPTGLALLMGNTPPDVFFRMEGGAVPETCLIVSIWPMHGEPPALVAPDVEQTPTAYAIVLADEGFEPIEDMAGAFWLAGPELMVGRKETAPETSRLILPPGVRELRA